MAQVFPHVVWFGTDFAPKQKENLIYLTSICKGTDQLPQSTTALSDPQIKHKAHCLRSSVYISPQLPFSVFITELWLFLSRPHNFVLYTYQNASSVTSKYLKLSHSLSIQSQSSCYMLGAIQGTAETMRSPLRVYPALSEGLQSSEGQNQVSTLINRKL